MLTGARVGEVRQALFEQFNLDLGIWSKPAATTKQRKIHRIPAGVLGGGRGCKREAEEHCGSGFHDSAP
jgi:hypothetical protein